MRLFQSPLGQIKGHNSRKISFELTGGSLSAQEALAEGLATFWELKRRKCLGETERISAIGRPIGNMFLQQGGQPTIDFIN